MIIILALFLSVLWKAYPDTAICALFWLSIVWITYSTKLVSRPAGLLILLGAVSNAVVTVFNGGVMPVVGMPNSFSPVFPVWQQAHGTHGLLLLADHASLYYFSIGDVLLIAGASMLLLSRLHNKFQGSAPQES
jgi:lipoprotein signal peptidase